MGKNQKEGVFGTSTKFVELIILYTSLLFVVLAQWYQNPKISEKSLKLLILSAGYSILVLIFGLLSSFLERPGKICYKKIIHEFREFLNRMSHLCFFVSVVLIFLTLNEIGNDIFSLDVILDVIIDKMLLFLPWTFLRIFLPWAILISLLIVAFIYSWGMKRLEKNNNKFLENIC